MHIVLLELYLSCYYNNIQLRSSNDEQNTHFDCMYLRTTTNTRVVSPTHHLISIFYSISNFTHNYHHTSFSLFQFSTLLPRRIPQVKYVENEAHSRFPLIVT